MTEIPMDRLKARAGTPLRRKVSAEPSERRFEPACDAQQDADRPCDLATENGVPNPAATWKKKGLHTGVRTALDPVVAAKLANLRHVSDDTAGITRSQARRGFDYRLPDGEPVRDIDTLMRIRSLVIPPAWTEVWICPYANGHIQAIGRDKRGRKQYRYHPRWREVRDEPKYGKLLIFGRVLPVIRERVGADLRRRGLSRERVLAAVVRLMEVTLFRVGNSEYARANKSYGLTTLRDRHVEIDGSWIHLSFRGKHGIRHETDITDRRLARIIKGCRDLPGYELFQYVDEDGNRRAINSRTSTTTCERSVERRLPRRIFGPGPPPILRPWHCRNLNCSIPRQRRSRRLCAPLRRWRSIWGIRPRSAEDVISTQQSSTVTSMERCYQPSRTRRAIIWLQTWQG